MVNVLVQKGGGPSTGPAQPIEISGVTTVTELEKRLIKSRHFGQDGSLETAGGALVGDKYILQEGATYTWYPCAKGGGPADAAAADKGPVADRRFHVRRKGARQCVIIQAKPNIPLEELKQLIRVRVAAVRRPNFTVSHENLLVTTDEDWWRVAKMDGKVELVVQSTAIAFSTKDGEPLRDVLWESLRVSTDQGMPDDIIDLPKELQPPAPKDIRLRQGYVEEEMTFDEFIKVIMHAFILRMESTGEGNPDNKQNHRAFIDLVMAASVLVARALADRDPKHRVKLVPEGPLIGQLALGRVDWLVVYRTLAVVVVEAKKGDIDKAWPQLYREMRAMRDNLAAAAAATSEGRKRSAYEAFQLPQLPSWAVLCTAREWHVVKHVPERAEEPASLCKFIVPVRVHRSTPRDELSADIRRIVLVLAAVITQQMDKLDEVIAQFPGMEAAAGKLTKEEVDIVEEAEAKAKLDEVQEEEEADGNSDNGDE